MSSRLWRQKNPERNKELQKRYREKLKKRFLENPEFKKQWFDKQRLACRSWRRKKSEHQKMLNKKNHRELRLAAIKIYGGKCVCCGVSDHEFLAIDHINNDGHSHRKSGVTSISRWLRKNNYPSGFQILCHNCNMAKAFYGKCPHQRTTA